MAWRVLDALTPRIHHRHRPSDRLMLRDHARRNEEASVPFVGAERRTGSGIMLQSLLFRLPRLQERVANAVTFPTRYRGSHSSIPLGNGGGVPVSGTYAPGTGTHPSNREHTHKRTRSDGCFGVRLKMQDERGRCFRVPWREAMPLTQYSSIRRP